MKRLLALSVMLSLIISLLTPVSFTAAADDFTITTASLPNGYVNDSYSHTLELSVSDASNVTWSISSGSLPTGLTLNENTGVIVGTTANAAGTAGTYTFTVKAENDAGHSDTKEFTLVIDKKTQAPPTMAPTIDSITATQVVVFAINGYEYAYNTSDNAPPIDSSVWQSSNIFTGLTPYTTYYFFSRFAETHEYYASEATTSLEVITSKAALTGSMHIHGTATVRNQLLTVTNWLSSNPQIASFGTFSYQWKRGDTSNSADASPISGATSDIYTLTTDDIGKYVFIEVTAENCEGSVTSAALGPVQKIASTPITPAENVTLSYTNTATQTVTLSDRIPTDAVPYTALTYTPGTATGANPGIIASSAPAEGGITFTIAGTAELGQTATIPVTITGFDDYENMTIDVIITLSDKVSTEVTFSSPTAGQEFVYSGSAAAADAYASADPSGTIEYLYTGTILNGETYNSATPPTNPGSYTVTATLVSDTHAGSASRVFSITQKALGWNGTTGAIASKVYDGTTAVSAGNITDPALSGVIAGDTVSVIRGTVVYTSANAGTNTVTASGYGIEGADAWKYTAPAAQPVFNTIGAITKANQTANLAIAGGDISVVYSDSPAEVTLTPSGGSGTGAYQWTSSNTSVASVGLASGVVTPGTGASSIGVTTISLTRLGDTNYNDLTTPATITFTLTKAPQTAPGAPSVSNTSMTAAGVTVTLNTALNAQYAYSLTSNSSGIPASGSGAWQDSNVFTALAPDTTYYFFVKYKETGTHNESSVGIPLSYTTPSEALVVAMPVANPNGGTFNDSVTVTLTSATQDAEIYYTTDGTAPTSASALYTSPFTLTSSATVKAIAVKAGMTDSNVTSAVFTKSAGQQQTPPQTPPPSYPTPPAVTQTPAAPPAADSGTIKATGNGKNTINIPASYNEATGEMRLRLNSALIAALIKDAQAHADGGTPTVVFHLSDTAAKSVIFDVTAAKAFADAGVSVVIELSGASVTLSADTLSMLASGQKGGAPIKIEAATVPMKDLKGMQAAQVKGYETVVDINVYVDGKKINAPLSVSVPYKLKGGESANGVVCWHLTDEGNLIKQAGVYDSAAGILTFGINHQSLYVIGYDPVNTWHNRFSDIPAGAWYYDAVAYADYYGLMGGAGDGAFDPQGSMTRAMFVTVLWNIEGRPQPAGTASFTDVNGGAWYYNPVMWAAEKGITSGTGDNKFSPDKPVNRQEIATMLYNYSQVKGYGIPSNRSLPPFRDFYDVDNWAVIPASILSEAGVLNGDAGQFKPKRTATRAEVAQMFKGFMRFVLGR